MIGVLGWLSFRAAVRWMPERAAAPQPASTLVLDRNGVPLAWLAASDGQWRLPLDDGQISPHLMNALVAVEDARFESHHGIDWAATLSAACEDAWRLHARRGASTLTMQLARLRAGERRTLFGKLTQAVSAEQIERRLTKRQILVEYVNRAPFGGNLVGAEAASRRYFGRACRDLSLGQAALLAGLPQAPNRFRPDRYPDRARSRREHVLDRMLACGFVTPVQRRQASAEPVNAAWLPLPQDSVESRPADADGALPTLLRLVKRRPDTGLRTTLDSGIQRLAASMAREHLSGLEPSGVHSAAVVVLETSSAECLAAISLDAGRGGVDLTARPRSTGSTLKPFIYALAFDTGVCGPESVLSDSPAAWTGYEPSDYDRAFRGPLTAAEALAESRNIPAMLVLARAGTAPAVGVLDAVGVHGPARSPDRYGLSLAVGGAEASPLELAEAYAALARGGAGRPVRFFQDLPASASPARAIRPAACWQVLDALSAADRTRAVCAEAAAGHVAWKTGTSSGHRDAWCAAVTRKFSIVVWVGNSGGEGSPLLVGQDAAAPLALRLAAALDPKEDPWPLVTPDRKAAFAAIESSGSELVLVSPTAGQQFVLTSDAPRERQRVRLRASCRAKAALKIWWFVDDRLLAASDPSQPQWWDASPGPHQIRVIDEHGQAASAQIRVRME